MRFGLWWQWENTHTLFDGVFSRQMNRWTVQGDNCTLSVLVWDNTLHEAARRQQGCTFAEYASLYTAVNTFYLNDHQRPLALQRISLLYQLRLRVCTMTQLQFLSIIKTPWLPHSLTTTETTEKCQTTQLLLVDYLQLEVWLQNQWCWIIY